MKRTAIVTETITVGELPKDGESLEALRAEVRTLQSRNEYLLFILQMFACSTIGAVLLALLFVSPWSAFLLMPPCVALALFLWFHFQKGA